jgi:hypothetical protein
VTQLSPTAGGLGAYQAYIEVMLHFHCSDCKARLEWPDYEVNAGVPFPPWSAREGGRGLALGWYVPPLTEDGSVSLICFCPTCTQKRGLIVQKPYEDDEG